MLNMIDIYFKMNSCERDSLNNVYYVDMSKGKREEVGRIQGYKVKDGTLFIDFVSYKLISFINVTVNVSKP